MASITGGMRILVEEEEVNSSSNNNPTNAVIFVGISLVLGIASRQLLRGTRVPYTVALLILGIGLGALGIIIKLINSTYFINVFLFNNHIDALQ